MLGYYFECYLATNDLGIVLGSDGMMRFEIGSLHQDAVNEFTRWLDAQDIRFGGRAGRRPKPNALRRDAQVGKQICEILNHRC